MVRSRFELFTTAAAFFATSTAQAQTPSHAEAEQVVHGPLVVHLNQSSQTDVNFSPESRYLAQLPWAVTSGNVTPLANGSGLSYSAPEKQYPQVVILGAYNPRSKKPVVHLLQLIGAPTVEVDSEPNVDVVVEVAGVSFGPRRTDRSGTALVPVEVPPGIDTAITLATDSHGNVTRGELPLNPPDFPRGLALCSTDEPAVYVVEVSRRGEPVTRPSFEVRAAGLSARDPEVVAPGVFRVELTANPKHAETQLHEVRVVLEGNTSSCTLTTTPPASIMPYVLRGSVAPLDPDGHWSMGAHVGWLTNGERVSGPWGSLLVGYSFSGRPAGLRAEAELGYSQTSTSLITTDNEPVELDVRTWPLFLTARYVLDFGSVHPSAALNLGVAVTEARAAGEALLTDETFVTPWLGGAAAVWWWLGQHEVGAEVGYALAERSTGAVVGNVAGARFLFDYRYIFH